MKPRPVRRDGGHRGARAVERSCDLAWLHLLGAGLVTSHPDDLVTVTLRAILREARDDDRRRAA